MIDRDAYRTPKRYLEMARKVMGDIELDPASSAFGQENVQAERYFTAADDGLVHEWRAQTIWLNPPYSRGNCLPFVKKLLDSFANLHFESAIVLVNSSTETEWYQRLMLDCDAACFPAHRIQFEHPVFGGSSNRYAQTFFYFGDVPLQFGNVFGEIGVLK